MKNFNFFSSKKWKYAILGGAALSICGGLFTLYKHRKPPQRKKTFSRVLILRVLRRFDRNYYPIYKYLAASYARAVAEIRAEYGYMPGDLTGHMYRLLVQSNHTFRNRVEELENQVFAEFGISERSAFKAQVRELRATDEEVAAAAAGIQKKLLRICSGRPLSLDIPLGDFITAEVTFQIFREISYTVMMRMHQFISERVARKKPVDPENSKFVRKLARATDVEGLTSALLKQNGFDFSEKYHAQLVYDAAIHKFLKTKSKYYDSVSEIIQTERSLLGFHLRHKRDLQALREQIEQIKKIPWQRQDSMANVAYSMRNITADGRMPSQHWDEPAAPEKMKRVFFEEESEGEPLEEAKAAAESEHSTKMDFGYRTQETKPESELCQKDLRPGKRKITGFQESLLLEKAEENAFGKKRYLKIKKRNIVDLDSLESLAQQRLESK